MANMVAFSQCAAKCAGTVCFALLVAGNSCTAKPTASLIVSVVINRFFQNCPAGFGVRTETVLKNGSTLNGCLRLYSSCGHPVQLVQRHSTSLLKAAKPPRAKQAAQPAQPAQAIRAPVQDSASSYRPAKTGKALGGFLPIVSFVSDIFLPDTGLHGNDESDVAPLLTLRQFLQAKRFHRHCPAGGTAFFFHDYLCVVIPRSATPEH